MDLNLLDLLHLLVGDLLAGAAGAIIKYVMKYGII